MDHYSEKRKKQGRGRKLPNFSCLKASVKTKIKIANETK
jgi:hypothetical protein